MFYCPYATNGDPNINRLSVIPFSSDQSKSTSAPAARVSSSPACEFLDADRAAAARARPYSAEERRERVERYRSKRNQRNFHKKITYACRKTLADRRPRVRGRFARNEETEAEAESSKISFECGTRSTCDNGSNCSNPDGSENGGDRWRQMQAAVDGKQEFRYDEDIWTYLDNMFSTNFL